MIILRQNIGWRCKFTATHFMFTISQFTKQQRGPIALFLGAGAAVGDGLPSTDKLAKQMRDFLKEKHIDNAFLLPDSLSAFLEQPNAESLMKLVGEVWDLYQRTPDLMILLYHFLTLAVAKCTDLPDTGIDGFRTELISRLYKKDSPLFILTTNWDTSLDTILQSIVTRGNTKKSLINYGFGSASAEVTEQLTEGKPIHFYKLNGSADWFLCHVCKKIETTKIVKESRGVSIEWDDKDHMIHCRTCKRLMERVIVLPTLGQARNPVSLDELDTESVSAINIHLQATNALRSAQDLIFVGYSLPSYDIAIRKLISFSLKGNAFVQAGRSTITVIAKDQLGDVTKKNFSEIFGEKSFLFHNQGLEHFLSITKGDLL